MGGFGWGLLLRGERWLELSPGEILLFRPSEDVSGLWDELLYIGLGGIDLDGSCLIENVRLI